LFCFVFCFFSSRSKFVATLLALQATLGRDARISIDCKGAQCECNKENKSRHLVPPPEFFFSNPEKKGVGEKQTDEPVRTRPLPTDTRDAQPTATTTTASNGISSGSRVSDCDPVCAASDAAAAGDDADV
jgi:hypothetical protein